MKNNTRLYNFILPPYLLLVFIPWLALISVVGNFIIDSIVLLVISYIVFKKIDKSFYIKNIFKVWLLGFLADFVGIVYMFIGSEIGYSYINSHTADDSFVYNLMFGMNNVTNHSNVITVYSVCFILSAILIAAIAIFVFDYFLAFRKANLTKKQKFRAALAFALVTAPYTFLLPESLFY